MKPSDTPRTDKFFLTWTEASPNRLGYYWLKQGPRESIVHVIPQRAFGNKLCALLEPVGGRRDWMLVEQVSGDTESVLWAGPIQPPAEK